MGCVARYSLCLVLMRWPLWEVTRGVLAGGQEGPSPSEEPSFSHACCAMGVLGRGKPPSTCSLWAHSLLKAAGRASRNSRHEAQPGVGSRASQVPAVPMGAVQFWGSCWGAAGVSTLGWQHRSPVSPALTL